MAHIKILSISKKWSAYDLIKKIQRFYKLSKEDLDLINLLHIEELPNGRYHMRVGVNNYKVINKIKTNGELTKDGKAYIIRMKELTCLFTIVDSAEESFKIEKISGNSNLNNLVIWIKMKSNDNILTIAKILQQNQNIQFNYISLRKTSGFLHLSTLKDSRKVQKMLKEINYICKFSSSVMYIEKVLQNKSEKMVPKLKIVTKPRKEVDKSDPVKIQASETAIAKMQHQHLLPSCPVFPYGQGYLSHPHYNQLSPQMFPWSNSPLMMNNPQPLINNLMPFNQSSVLDLSQFNIALIPKTNNQ